MFPAKLLVIAIAGFSGLPLSVQPASGGECDRDATDYLLVDAIPMAEDAGFEYEKDIHRAFSHDRESLSRLFALTVAGVLDGSGADSHASVLWDLMQCWGDDEFSRALSQRSSETVRRVIAQLTYAQADLCPECIASFPKTFSLTRPLVD